MEIIKLVIQNFMSVGLEPIEFHFNKNEIILIHGKNGAGKSMIAEALCILFFKKSYRKGNKTITNFINVLNKNEPAVITLYFKINGKNYVIQRTINPGSDKNKVIIKENGRILDISYSDKSSLKYIEDDILGGMKFENFKSLLICAVHAESRLKDSKTSFRDVMYRLHRFAYPDFKEFLKKKITALKKQVEPLEEEETRLQSILDYLISEKDDKNKFEINKYKTELEKLRGKDIEDKMNNPDDSLFKMRYKLYLWETIINTLKNDAAISRHMIDSMPEMNMKIQEYLNKLIPEETKKRLAFSFNSSMEIDEPKNDVVFGLFSEGEKMCVELAVFFTILDLQSERNKVNLNFVIFDETLNSSLDKTGTMHFMKLLRDFGGTALVLTYDEDLIGDIQYDRKIYMERENDVYTVKKEENITKQLLLDIPEN